MDALTVDVGDELGSGIAGGFGGTPVEPGAPVVGEATQVGGGQAVGPGGFGQVLGPAGAGEAVVQVVEVGLRNVDPEGVDVVHADHATNRLGRNRA